MPRSLNDRQVTRLLNDSQTGKYNFTPSPQDWRDLWIYFVITDRFNNPASPPAQPWNSPAGTFQGGTFAGIQAQLDYLKDLGVGALWISPVLKNSQYNPYSYHGYGIQDFISIDPRFSSDPQRARRQPSFVEGELRQLVDAAHARGIYVIFDIVLNHAGDVFAYEGDQSDLPWRDDGPYPIFWRDGKGRPRHDWSVPPTTGTLPADGLVWPRELQRNEFFRRQGNAFSRQGEQQEQAGDFFSLKELVTDYFEPHPAYGNVFPVRNALILAHLYLMAKYDIDSFRIDTLKYLEPDFVANFGNAVREYALSIGKKNFFTFGEVYDSEEKIAHFIGRNAHEDDELLGVDAALDFPLFFHLPAVVKSQAAPLDLIQMFEHRRQVTSGVISSHGEASRYFVSFLDNHDQNSRFHYVDPSDPHRFDDQTTLGLALLFTLQGIPCLYYGSEQGLSGSGDRPEFVREALWGMPRAFSQRHPFYRTVRQLSALRQNEPAIRYGRQYFRQVSGDGVNFGFSSFPGGVLAFSRLMADLEIVVVANMNLGQGWSGEVLVDYHVQPGETNFKHLYTNQASRKKALPPTPALERTAGTVSITNLDGSSGSGPTRVIHVDLLPGEVQIWGKGL